MGRCKGIEYRGGQGGRQHGEKTVPLFSRIFIDQKHVRLDARQKEAVLLETRSWFSRYQALQSGRTSGWTSGVQLARIIAAIAPAAPMVPAIF